MKQRFISSYKVEVFDFFHQVAGIPNIYYFCVEGEYSVMVMDLLGLSIEDLFSHAKRMFSPKTVMMIADQMVAIILLTF